MAKYIGRFIAPLALGAVVTLGACKTDSSKQDTTSALNRDTSALGRDLAPDDDSERKRRYASEHRCLERGCGRLDRCGHDDLADADGDRVHKH